MPSEGDSRTSGRARSRSRSRSRSPRRNRNKGGFRWKERKRPDEDEGTERYSRRGEEASRYDRQRRDDNPDRYRRRDPESDRHYRSRDDRPRDNNDDYPSDRYRHRDGDSPRRSERKERDAPGNDKPKDEKDERGDKKEKKKDKKKKTGLAVPQQEMIMVHVNDRLGTKTAIACLPSDPIKLFKIQVAAQIGREPHEILLKRQGERPFKDQLTLEDYGISNGVQLDLEVDTGD